MAMRKSKKKLPRREDKMIDVEKRIEARVFDRATLKVISKFMSKKLFDRLDNPIKMGKEANVFRGVKLDKNNKPIKYYAVKIYRIETTSFNNMSPYIIGDPRFNNVKKSKFEFIKTWTRKEYINLKTAFLAGVNVPEPVAYDRNIIIMKFIGENGLPYPPLNICKKSELEYLGQDIKTFFTEILNNIKKLYNAGLVHADFSEYNVLVTRNGPVLIDFSQSVSVKHPNAKIFLERDLNNFLRVCRRFRVNMEGEVNKFISSLNPESNE
ncbi:serine protein kinase RIO [Candidatus Micrarchaeota archaeon]|nr:serine protein kinase RIO [Candidatus Micrarchaeota archaeon]